MPPASETFKLSFDICGESECYTNYVQAYGQANYDHEGWEILYEKLSNAHPLWDKGIRARQIRRERKLSHTTYTVWGMEDSMEGIF